MVDCCVVLLHLALAPGEVEEQVDAQLVEHCAQLLPGRRRGDPLHGVGVPHRGVWANIKYNIATGMQIICLFYNLMKSFEHKQKENI